MFLLLSDVVVYGMQSALCSCSYISVHRRHSMGTCMIKYGVMRSLLVPPGRAHAPLCMLTLGRAAFEIPMQLLFCIASHMAGTINTVSNCSSQPANVQSREKGWDRGWGWGKKTSTCLKKNQKSGKGEKGSPGRQQDSLPQCKSHFLTSGA